MNDLNDFGAAMIARPAQLQLDDPGLTDHFAPVPDGVGLGEEQAPPGAVDLEAAELAVRDLLIALGEDPSRDGLRDTPRRVAKAMAQLMAGRFADPAEHLSRIFEQRCDDLVALRKIELFSICEHHLLPFLGHVHIAYLPDHGRVVGLSKLARVVEVYARRPQLQERLTNQIADAIDRHVRPRGVAVIVEAEHLCMKMRGVCKTHPSMRTLAFRGEFETNEHRRAEVITALLSG